MRTLAVYFRYIKNLQGALHQHIIKSKGEEKYLLTYHIVIYVLKFIYS